MPVPARLPRGPRAAFAISAAAGVLIGLLVYLLRDVPPELQNVVLFLVVLPFAAGTGATLGLLLRRPGAGGWAFAVVFLGALVGNLARAVLVDSRVYPWGPYDWEAVELTSVLAGLWIGALAGASGYVTGLITTRSRPSGALAAAGLALGIAPTLFGFVMMPVAAVDWAMGYPGTLVISGIVLSSGVALILGGGWTWWRLARRAGPTASWGAMGSERPPPRAP